MGPLFSAMIAALLIAAYTGVSYLIVRIVTRKSVPLLHVGSIVLSGILGAVVAAIIGGFVFSETPIESQAGVLFFFSAVSLSAVVFSSLGYRFITKWKH